MIINRRGFGPAINYNNMDMNGKPKPDLDRVEQARQAFMRLKLIHCFFLVYDSFPNALFPQWAGSPIKIVSL